MENAMAQRRRRRNPIPDAEERAVAISNRGLELHSRSFLHFLHKVKDVLQNVEKVVTVAVMVLSGVMDALSYGWLYVAAGIVGQFLLNKPPLTLPGGEHLGNKTRTYITSFDRQLVMLPPPPDPSPPPITVPHFVPDPPERRPCPRCALP
ncbi:hypothetical protein BP6252_02027 [Coleophoma cylindrospora]|uniref:Uncharacterized protein n=1 Tax=Coleophoma cylindrospora TaxID=1849047 RepID=A0A3D8SDL4_9HELO|nr:hypothetical protein BP6252_02027 [Coleophoma cylindrospora]